MSIENEFILCSALLFKDEIIAGRKHSDCYKTLKLFSVIKEEFPEREHQGFLTSENRFVDRFEGWKIAVKHNQIKYGLKISEKGEKSQLISENLFGCD